MKINKNEILEKAKKANACIDGYLAFKKAVNEKEQKLLLLKNISWLKKHNIIDVKDLQPLPAEMGGYFYVSGCDLKGVKLPAEMNILK